MKKRVLSTLLCLCMVLSLLPNTALAAPEPRAGMSVNPNDDIQAGDTVLFGHYPDDSGASVPIEWRVLDPKSYRLYTSNGPSYYLSGSGAGYAMLLITEHLIAPGEMAEGSGTPTKDPLAFSDAGTTWDDNNAWKVSSVKQWCQTFYEDAFNEYEKAQIMQTTQFDGRMGGVKSYDGSKFSTVTPGPDARYGKPVVSKEYVFFPSLNEIDRFIGKVAYADKYVDEPEKKAATYQLADGTEAPSAWWTRSAVYSYPDNNLVVRIRADGKQEAVLGSKQIGGARPMINATKQNIFMLSSSENGKPVAAPGTVTAVPEYDSSAWEMTIYDDAHTLRSVSFSEQLVGGAEVAFTYGGASLGHRLSVAITDGKGGPVLYFGTLVEETQTANGKATLTLPADFDPSKMALYFFTETRNSADEYDLASKPVIIEPNTTPAAPDARTVLLTDPSQLEKDDVIYFGSYIDDDDDSYDRLAWRVLNPNAGNATGSGDQLTMDGSPVENTDAMFLVADRMLVPGHVGSLSGYTRDPIRFNTSSNAWQGSNAQTWCKNMYDVAFTEAEKDMIPSVSKSDPEMKNVVRLSSQKFDVTAAPDILQEDFVFLPSLWEIHEYIGKVGHGDSGAFNNPTLKRTAYERSDGSYRYSSWWTRSPTGSSQVVWIDSQGFQDTVSANSAYGGVRPALNLMREDIVLVSAAVNGKVCGAPGTVTAVPLPQEYEIKEFKEGPPNDRPLGYNIIKAGDDWKLTLRDDAHTLTNVTFAEELAPGETVAFHYTGASLGHTLSVIITNGVGGSGLYYGTLVENTPAADGTAYLTLPDDFDPSTMALYFLTETRNGDMENDFGSTPVVIPPNSDPTPVDYVAERITPSGETTSYETLTEALGAAQAGDTVRLLKNADLTRSVPQDVVLVVPSGKTLSVPAATANDVLASKGTLRIDAGGNLSMPNTVGALETFVGATDDARIHLSAGSLYFAFADRTLTLPAGAVASVPAGKTAYLLLGAEKLALNAVIEKDAKLTVAGTLKAISGKDQEGSHITVAGTLDAASGTLSLAKYAVLTVEETGALAITPATMSTLTGTVNLHAGSTATVDGAVWVGGTEDAALQLTAGTLTANFQQVADDGTVDLAFTAAKATIPTGKRWTLKTGPFFLRTTLDADSQLTVAGEFQVANGTSLTLNGKLDIPAGGTMTISSEGTVSGSGSIDTYGALLIRQGAASAGTLGVNVSCSGIVVYDGTAPDAVTGTITLRPSGKVYGMSNIESKLVHAVATEDKIYDGKTYTHAWIYDDPTVFTITFDANGGTVSPTSVDTQTGGVLATLPTPTRSGYNFDGWFTDPTGGTKITNGHTFTQNTTLYAHWTEKSSGGGGGGGGSSSGYTITASVTGSGTITPSGRVKVDSGEDMTFTITPGRGYRISDVLVDGKSVGAVDDYTFQKVTASHTIQAVFSKAVADPDTTGVARWLNTDDHVAYLQGYPGGTVGPDRNMARAEIAQVFYALLLDKDVPITVTFTDVPEDAWYAPAVNTLASMGILNGVGGGRFDPYRPITRAEFAAIVARFANPAPDGTVSFPDVKADDWFYDAVHTAVAYGWINGCPDGTFQPMAFITRGEVTKIVNSMLDRLADQAFADEHANELVTFSDLSVSHWAYEQILEAANAHQYTRDETGIEDWTALGI